MLAPVVGPLLDQFRHGRRYALAATMLGRAFLAWLISDYIHGFGLYPAAFGVLALSRAYGVARRAAVPRLLPRGARPVPGGRPGQRLRHGRRRAGGADRAGRVLVRAAVAAAGRVGDLPGRHGDLAAAAAEGRLGATGAGAPATARAGPPPWRPAAGRGRPSGRLVIATLIGARDAARAVRLPAALPRLRDQGGRPDHRGVRPGSGRRGRAGPGRRRARRRHVPGHRDRHPAAHPPARPPSSPAA